MFKPHSHIHFIGIGGVSMSALALILKNDGHTVTGSDFKETATTCLLETRGIPVAIGHEPHQVDGADLVVYTAAIHADNPELVAAREKGIPTYERCIVLGEMMKAYRYPILVSGTHGKTTTTSMLASVFMAAAADPTVLVGGNLAGIDGNHRIGGPDYFIAEACEYVESFLDFFPYVAILLDVEEDHMDYFRDLEHIVSAFRKFAELVPEDGLVIVNGDDKNALKAVQGLTRQTVTAGLTPDSDYYAKDVTYDDKARASFTLCTPEGDTFPIRLGVAGSHNVSNALCAIAAARRFGLAFEDIARGLWLFTGAERRFEYKGEVNGVRVYDDYAHHPTELKTTLEVGNKIKKDGRLFILFQPHTYTRTQAFWKEFKDVLSQADRLVLADIYAARETDTLGVSSAKMAQEIDGAVSFPTFEAIADYVRKEARAGDVVVTVGAGDVFRVGELLLEE